MTPLEWRVVNRERYLQKRREWHTKNRERVNQRKRELYFKNNYYLRHSLPWKQKNPEKVIAIERRYRPKRLERMIIYNQLDYVKQSKREYELDHPRSRARKGFIMELDVAMNNVRKRDQNICQWFGCGLTNRQAPIHVHHIFPKSEYPELQLVEQYMICYCANHHGLWHRYRGDNVSALYKNIPHTINGLKVEKNG